MRLKILHHLHRTAPSTINYRFHQVLAALDLLGPYGLTWILSGAIITWPEDLLDSQNELLPDPGLRFSKDNQSFVCTHAFFLRIAHGVEGDWTEIHATRVPWNQLGPQLQADIPDPPSEFRFECIDAAFWTVESSREDLAGRLQAHGFVTEPLEQP